VPTEIWWLSPEAVHSSWLHSDAAQIDRKVLVDHLSTHYGYILSVQTNDRFLKMNPGYDKSGMASGIRQSLLPNTRETRERRNEHRRIQIRGCIGTSAPSSWIA